MDRRQFLAAATAACAAYGMAAVKSAEASNQRSELAGVCDIHLHAAPDSRARSLSEYDMALEAKAAGYRAVLFKSNDFSCHDRAYLLRQAVSGIELFGSLVLNRATGTSLNVYAVEKALAQASEKLRALDATLADPEFYNGSDQDLVAKTLREHGELAPKVEALEMRWLELSEAIEAIC